MKKLFIGIDVSKETIDVTAIIPQEDGGTPEPVHYGRYENRPRGFRSMVAAVRRASHGTPAEDWMFCCETTGGYDHRLCRYLCKEGLFLWRESALCIRNSRGIKLGKDDKSDSRTIAEYAWRYADRAKPLVQPTAPMERLRQLCRHRAFLVRERGSMKRRAAEIKATGVEGDASASIYRDTVKLVESLDRSIARCEEEMREAIAADRDMRRNYGHVVSILGVSFVTAASLIAFTGNSLTVDSSRKASRYCGCCCAYDDSGTSVHRKVDTRNFCNRQLKAVLTMAAVAAIRSNPEVRQYYERLSAKGKPYGIVVNNVRNKLLHIIYALVAHDADYDAGYCSGHGRAHACPEEEGEAFLSPGRFALAAGGAAS